MTDLLGVGGTLPSPSFLTGNFRAQAAATFVEQAIAEAKARAAGSRVGTPSGGQRRGTPEEVGALRNMASRHLGALDRSPRAHASHGPAPPPLRPPQPLPQPPPQPQPQPQPSPPGAPQPTTAPQVLQLLASSPAPALPPLALSDDPPGPASPTAAAAASASPRHQQPEQPQQPPAGVRFASAAPSRPATALSVQDLSLPRPGSRLAAGRSPLALAAPPDALRASSLPTTPLAGAARAGWGGGGGGGEGGSQFRTGARRYTYTVTRRAMEAVGGPTAADSLRRPCHFKVSRGMVYSVFQELDEFDLGRITYSAFEQAACKAGMRPPQARRMFAQLDPEDRGFATMRDWSRPALEKTMEAFTRLYVHATRAEDGRPHDFTEMRSVHMAIQMAMIKLRLKRCGRAISMDRLVEAFRFIDRDGSGTLNGEEVEDALNALGIFVTPEVVVSIMSSFDKDKSGEIDYNEFCTALHPTLSQSLSQANR